MITDYAHDTSQWKAWQKEYRYGVLLIYPPDPPLSAVNALRARYQWSQSSTCDAHISLTVPLPRPLEEHRWRELESIASRIESFSVHYGPLMNYLPHPGVCLAVEPQSRLDSLRVDLESSSVFAGAPERRHPFSAHMTIAELLTVEQTHAIMAELEDVAPEGDFVCTGVSYAVPDVDFRFTERRRLDLS